MTAPWTMIARDMLDATEQDRMNFAESIGILSEAGFDGYAVDFREARRTYYLPDGRALALPTATIGVPVAERFEVQAVSQAIKEAQDQVPGYSYAGFCDKVAAAGCAGYVVSLLGKCVLYVGRSGETHTEYFPGAGPAAQH